MINKKIFLCSSKFILFMQAAILIFQAFILMNQYKISEKQLNLSIYNSKQPMKDMFINQEIKYFEEICSIIATLLIPDKENSCTKEKLARVQLKSQHFIPEEAYNEIDKILKEFKKTMVDIKKIEEHFIKMQEFFIQDINKKLKFYFNSKKQDKSTKQLAQIFDVSPLAMQIRL